MGRIQRTRAWLSVLPSTVNGTELGAQEWRYFLFLRYSINPPEFLDHCDGCRPEFSIRHVLGYNKGCLLTACYNELHDGFADLSSKSFTPMHMPGDPKIFTGHNVHGRKAKSKVKGAPTKDEEGIKGDLLIIDL